MTETEIIEALRVVRKELNMSPAEYADYINEKHHITKDIDKVTPDVAWAYRTGGINAQIEFILSEMERRNKK